MRKGGELHLLLVEEDDPTKFYPGRTRRVSALVARSPSVTDRLVAHPLSCHVCDTHLLPNSEHGYQLRVSATVEVRPGAREQVLHREESSFIFFPLPRPNIIVASMWAVTEYRADNGAILLVRAATNGLLTERPGPTRFGVRRCRPARCCSGWAERCTVPGPTGHRTGATA